MEDLNIEDVKQLVNFYRQKVSDLELSNLQWQIKYNRAIASAIVPVPATKITKTKSE